jgi:cysteine desulfurase
MPANSEIQKCSIYLDHAATTPVDPVVLEAMKPYFTEQFYNPSSFYTPARACARAVDDARSTIAECFNVLSSDEIIFTGSGSESDNMAIYGIPMANSDKGRHIITIPIEHHAVLHAVERMKLHGFDHTIVPVDKDGIIDLEELKKAIRDDTVLITVMFANNEIGTIQPIKEIGEIARERGIFFHTDAVQAAGTLPIDLQELNVDALTISAHKFYGPKGVGALYLRKNVKMLSLIQGGAQENRRRAGTHNTPAIVGLAKSLKLACTNMQENNKKIGFLRDKLVKGILDNLDDVSYNGHSEKRLPNNANFCFKFVESESILLHFDMLGICASSGSACSTGSEAPSHVLAAIGITPDIARSSIRLTLGKNTTEEQVDFVTEKIIETVKKLRAMSPLL